MNGYSSGEQNDFSSGDQAGPLRHRPNRYVPVKVPLYDEQGTINDQIAVANSDDDRLTKADVDARFGWVYRPELSFSMIDLMVSEINEEDLLNPSNTINLLNEKSPVISSTADLVKVIFNLIGSEYERITSLDGEQQYIFALGDQEIEVTLDKGKDGSEEQQISFSNLEYLSELEVEDYLTLSLYLNQDAQNTLWEWAFTTLDVDIDSDNNNGFESPDRTPEEENIEKTQQHTGKRIRVNTGDINNNDIPDFAEFDYLDETGARIGKPFVPFVVEIPPEVPIVRATLSFQYSGSDPLGVTSIDDPDNEGKKIYTRFYDDRERDQPIEDLERQFTTPEWEVAMFDCDDEALLKLTEALTDAWGHALKDGNLPE
ncbi:MAG: hypothetical protein ACJA0I_000021 [Gammaproteobacteria bacterium]|nr:hypothetical protein [Oceanospirillaceae bacterium]